MAEATTTRPTPLLDTLLALIAAHRPTFGQERPYQRCLALVLGHLAAWSYPGFVDGSVLGVGYLPSRLTRRRGRSHAAAPT
jgi:hypothetical protein